MVNSSKYEFHWLYVRSKSSAWWEVDFAKAYYGSQEIAIKAWYVTFDTGSSLVYLPMDDFKNLFELINANNKNLCEDTGGVIFCYRCSESGLWTGHYEPIILTLNNIISIKIPPKYYMEYEKQNDRCMLLFKGIKGNLDHWVLGDSIFKFLYTVFDAENYRIGIMTNELTLGNYHENLVTSNEMENMINFKTVICISLIMAFLLFLIAISCKWYLRKRRI